jgi:hypothetical protein
MAEGPRESTNESSAWVDDAPERVEALRQFREYLAHLIQASAESSYAGRRAPAFEDAA